MRSETLFEAIGNLDENMIAETENVNTKNTKRVGWKVALVAAIVAGLAVTAGAAPLIRNALLGGKVETDDRAWFTATNPENGNSYELRQHEITLDVEFDEDAPIKIKTFYIPQIPEGYKQIYGYLYSGSWVKFTWASEDYTHDITFWQTAGGAAGPDDLLEYVHTVPGDAPKTELRTFAGIQGYLIEEKPVAELHGSWIFYWSDGDYLFRLSMPYEYTDAQIEETITNIYAVEDITPYLIDMTDQEIGEALG